MLNLPRFVFINGPSGSGKSTLAGLLCSTSDKCWQESFAEPIRDMIRTVFFPEQGPINYDVDLKDGPTKKIFLKQLANLDVKAVGPTLRQAMINFSEGYMKPNFGQDIFGHLLWKRCQDQSLFYDHFIIDDSGFAPEARFIIDQVGTDNCVLIRLHRNGCDFTGDSRSYVDLPIKTIPVRNDSVPLAMLDELHLKLGNL